MNRQAALMAVGVFGALALAGCSSDTRTEAGHGHGEVAPFTGDEDFIIEVRTGDSDEFTFTPGTLEVTPGSTVGMVFTNAGSMRHDIVIPELGFHLTAAPGETAKGAFTAPDRDAEYRCMIQGHAELGMVGTLKVTEA